MIVGEYFGEGQWEKRKAEVHLHQYDKYFYVKLYENGVHTDTRLMQDKSERYAEDCAENWVLGVFHGRS